MDNKKILLLCWDFPPNPGIGGRRWAKMAKWFLKQDFELHVIKSSSKNDGARSAWLDDVSSKKITINNIEPYFAVKWLNAQDATFLGKIKYRLGKTILSTVSKGTIYDKAIGKEKDVVTLASELIKKFQISKLIVTGAPFNLMYYAAKIKKKNPNLLVIADYRDPWLLAVNYGMKGLGAERKKVEEEKQNFVFENVDYVTAPNKFLLQQIKDTYTGSAGINAKFVELEHAFDPDDYSNISSGKSESDSLKIVYAGSLYMETEAVVKQFIDEIVNYRKTFKKNVEVAFYTDDYKSAMKYDQPGISFLPPVGKDIFKILESADYVLILLAEHNKNFKTTKFFEYLPFQKPYLFIGSQGYVSESIEKEELGVVLKDLASDTKTFLTAHFNNSLKPRSFKDISEYTFAKRVESLLTVLEKK